MQRERVQRMQRERVQRMQRERVQRMQRESTEDAERVQRMQREYREELLNQSNRIKSKDSKSRQNYQIHTHQLIVDRKNIIPEIHHSPQIPHFFCSRPINFNRLLFFL